MSFLIWLAIILAWIGALYFGVTLGRLLEQESRKQSPEFITPRFLRRERLIDLEGEEFAN